MRALQLHIVNTEYPANNIQRPSQLVTAFLVDVFAQLHTTGSALDIDLIMKGKTVVVTRFYLGNCIWMVFAHFLTVHCSMCICMRMHMSSTSCTRRRDATS